MVPKQARDEEVTSRGRLGEGGGSKYRIVTDLSLRLNFLRKKKNNKSQKNPKHNPTTNLSCLESDQVNRINSPYEKNTHAVLTQTQKSEEKAGLAGRTILIV